MNWDLIITGWAKSADVLIAYNNSDSDFCYDGLGFNVKRPYSGSSYID